MSQTRQASEEKDKKKIASKRVVIFDDYHGISHSSSQRPATQNRGTVRAKSEALTSSTFYMMQVTRDEAAKGPNLPLDSRPVSDLVLDRQSGPGVKCFHEVNKAHLKDPSKKDELYFFKHNPPGSIVSELEAMAASFYTMIAPYNVPETTAYYNEKGEHVGVSSKAIPGFQSLVDAPLTSDDFCNSKLISSLAVGLVTSHFFMEDDLHRGNIDKHGHRLDFDMSFWSIFSQFKDSGPIDWALRTPHKHSFMITANDIRHFPNIQDTKPFYWPTNEAPVIREPLRSTVAKVIPISKNAYKVSDNNLFRNLEKHPDFIYSKFKTYLKIALTDADIYQTMAKARVRNNIEVNGAKLVDVITTTMQERITTLRQGLSAMPEFHDFLAKNGEDVLREIMLEFHDYNQGIKEKARQNPAYLDLLIHLPDIQKRYKTLHASLFAEDKQVKSFELTDSLFHSHGPDRKAQSETDVKVSPSSAPSSLPASKIGSQRFTI